MKENSPKIAGMTIAVFDMESMLQFYKELFLVEFTKQEMFGANLYSGSLGAIKILFCPAEIAQNTSKQNRHQLDIVVADLDETIKRVSEFGGKILGEPTSDKKLRQVGIHDPDNNSLTLLENLD